MLEGIIFKLALETNEIFNHLPGQLCFACERQDGRPLGVIPLRFLCALEQNLFNFLQSKNGASLLSIPFKLSNPRHTTARPRKKEHGSTGHFGSSQ